MNATTDSRDAADTFKYEQQAAKIAQPKVVLLKLKKRIAILSIPLRWTIW